MLYLLNFLYSIGLNAISKVLPAYLASKGVSASAISAINSSYGATRALGPAALGRSLDKLPRFILLFACFISLFVLAVVASLSTNTVFLALIFGVFGVISAVFYMTLSAVATILNHERKSSVLAKLEFVYQIGFIIGTLGASGASLYFGFKAVFFIWAVTSLTGAWVLMKAIRRQTHEIPHSKPTSITELFAQIRHGVFAYLVGNVAIGVVEGARDVYIPIALIAAGYEYQAAGYAFAIAATVTGIGMYLLSNYFDTTSSKFALFVSFATMAVGILVLPLCKSLLLFGVVVGVISLGRTAALTVTRTHVANATSEGNRATGLGMYELFFSMGRVIGAVAMGVVIDLTGTHNVWVISVVIAVSWALMSRKMGARSKTSSNP